MIKLDEGEVLFAHHGDDWVLRILGPLRYTNANAMDRVGHAQPVLFSTNPEINELLTSVCLDDVCCIVAGSPPEEAEEGARPIPAASPTERELARTISDAHRVLCELSEDNRAQFQSVVDAFSREAGQH